MEVRRTHEIVIHADFPGSGLKTVLTMFISDPFGQRNTGVAGISTCYVWFLRGPLHIAVVGALSRRHRYHTRYASGPEQFLERALSTEQSSRRLISLERALNQGLLKSGELWHVIRRTELP
jgi:hypothetical protein